VGDGQSIVELRTRPRQVRLIPEDAQINKGDWLIFKKAASVLVFPALVYFFFVFYGGQHAAYDSRRSERETRCPHCRAGAALPGAACPGCSQTIGSSGLLG